MARRIALAILLSFVTPLPFPLVAQTPTAEVTGIVRDSASRSLIDVEIRASNLGTGYTYQAFSSSTGRYWLRGLPPGRYDVTASRIGLRSETYRNAGLAIGRTIKIDFTMRPFPVEVQPVTLRIAEVQIETTKSEISYVIPRERIARLPEESRQFIELAQLVPGATAGTPIGGPPTIGTAGPSIGALNRQSLGVLVDGGDFTEGLFGGLSGSVPLSAIQEFEVVQSQYSAELGRAASGIINVGTRRGGNELRVEGFGLYRHHALTARGPFEVKKPDFSRLHWGAAVAGPISPDRTLFFAAFERREQTDFSTVNTGGAFPSSEGTFETPFTDNLMFTRIDHRVSDDHEVTFRYAGEVGEQLIGVGGNRAFENGRKNTLDMHSGLVSHRWVPSRNWLNEARLHVISTRRALDRNAPPGPTLVYPSLTTGPNQGMERLRSVRVELRNDLSWISPAATGTHQIKLGMHLSWQENEVERVDFENGLFVFASDTASVPAFAIVTFGDAIRLDARNLQLALYAQDDWSPVPDLTLNLGLRYDIETNGSNQGFVSPFAGELPFIPTTPRAIDKDNLAPRVGIAWDPTGRGHTVVRGGFGIFYDASVAGPLLAFERSSGARTAQIPNPGTTDVDSLMIDPDNVGPAIWTNGEIETPMSRQYSVGVQQRFPGDLVVRIDGLFIQGRNLLLERDVNPVDPTGARRFPAFSDIFQVLSEGRAEAKMLLVEVRKAFPRGWLDIGYTLSDRKNTNDAWGVLVPQTDLDNLDLGAEWGPTAWDERHRVVATGEIELPFDLGLAAKVIYSSVRPFTAITGMNDNGDFSAQNDRPPGEGRNARRGPDFFRTDLGVTWDRGTWGAARIGLGLNIYNLFNTTNGDLSAVVNNIQSPLFGRPLAAFPGRQVEVGLRAWWK